MKPSAASVLAYMRSHGTITFHEAERDLHCHRLAARIADLRAEGIPIVSRTVTRDGRSWAEYHLAPVTEQLSAFG
jgi:hypothetical protein